MNPPIPRRTFLGGTLAVSALGALHAPFVRAQQTQTIRLSIGSSHPLATSWVRPAQTWFMPEVNKRLAAANSRHRIDWTESWGGALFKANATLASVGQGVVDLGFVWSNLEASKMPLSQVSLVTPFSTDNPELVGAAMQDLHDTNPAIKREWEQHNVVWLGASTVDTYHLFTKFPVNALSDLKGRKLSAPGAIGLWVRDSGAAPVAGNLTTFYTDVQTGVADGAVVTATGATASKIYEVAPFVTQVGMGAHNNGALAINQDTFRKLPEDVRTVITQVGRDFSRANGAAVLRQASGDMAVVADLGGKQSNPIKLSTLAAPERQKMVDTMGDIAGDYVKSNEGRGLPARQVLKAYMDALRKHGATPLRGWA
jgi:TRAP-type transport system periplasmic protein